MALGTDKKLYIAVGVLVVLGGALYFQKKQAKEEAATYSLAGEEKALPKLDIKDTDIKKVDAITITQPPGDAGKPAKVVLKKNGDTWELAEPLSAKANQSNVKSLLDNVKDLKISEVIDDSAKSYDKFDVSDGKALHLVMNVGKKKVVDLYFGQSGSRGEMTRIAGREGVYAVQGYSSFMYSRDTKGWRDLTIFKFDDKKAKDIEIENENGTFTFAKKDDKWTGKFKKAAGADKKIGKLDADKFDPDKVGDMLRAYKALNADGFGNGKKLDDVGLTKPTATVTITLADGGKKVLLVGDKAEGSSRWAKTADDAQIYSISSWAADWATAKPKKFTKGAKSAAPPGGGMHGLPPGLGGMGMPH